MLWPRETAETQGIATQGKFSGWGFWARWVLASSLGYGVGAFLGLCLAWMLIGIETTGPGQIPELFSLSYVQDPENATALRRSAVFARGGEPVYWSASIITGGFLQWLVVRQNASWARWFVVIVPLWFVVIATTDPDPLYVGGGITLLGYHAKDFALAGGALGAVIGLPLVLALRRGERRSSQSI